MGNAEKRGETAEQPIRAGTSSHERAATSDSRDEPDATGKRPGQPIVATHSPEEPAAPAVPQSPPDKPVSSSTTGGARAPGETPRRSADDSSRTNAPTFEFPIVGIGASAGGLEALQAMLGKLKRDNMSFVVVQHLSPVHESLLSELLGRATRIRVSTIQDGEVPKCNRIYVMPANADLEIRGGAFRLTHATPTVPRLPIDRFFRSLARELGAAAIGVILSGGGSNGTLGLKAVKGEGGITFVQDPGTAIQPSMPQSALDSGCADFCLPPQQIAQELMRLSAHPYMAPPDRASPARGLDPDGLSKIYAQLRAAFRVDFTQYKRSTLERRIERRMAVHLLDSVEGYLKFIQQSPGELDTLYRDMLIGVTSFFRDREVFEALQSVILPRIFERRPTDTPVRVWVAGCSTGEEAYSIAITILEHLGDRAAHYKIQIFATDLDEDAIRRARHGLFRANIELDVSTERLQRFFSARRNDEYQINRPIRDMVVFATQDLSRDPPFSRVDLVCCRNVLIYMQPPLQRKVLRIFHYALNPEGFMVLGNSESIGEASDLFSIVDRKLKLYLKKNTPTSTAFDFSLDTGARQGAGDGRPQRQEAGPMVSLQQIADRKVMDRFAPPGVVINESLDVLQFRGRTGAYLEPAPGVATLNVLKLARPELLMELRATIQKALHRNYPAESPPLHIKADGGYRHVILTVMPLQDAAAPPRCMLVLFRELVSPTPPDPDQDASSDHEQKDPRVVELERELAATKDYLQTMVEELETANQELKSANEELQSSNEELQSTNEELETSKEELQSVNEELATVNEELHNRMSELGVNNDDLTNVLGVIENAVILVGMDLRIRRFSRSAETHFNLISNDIGRTIADLKRFFFDAVDFESTVREVINRMYTVEIEVKSVDGRLYTLRIGPYKTVDHAIRGAVIELIPASKPGGAGRIDSGHPNGSGHPA